MFFKLFSLAGALFAGLRVVFSAAFEHLPQFASGVPGMVQTALVQQQFHALGLLVVALAIRSGRPSRWLLAAGGLMLLSTTAERGVTLLSISAAAAAAASSPSPRQFRFRLDVAAKLSLPHEASCLSLQQRRQRWQRCCGLSRPTTAWTPSRWWQSNVWSI